VAGTVARERRASPRVPALTIEGMERARLRPGRTAQIVDVSSGGALIETDWRLLPGMRVELQVGEPIPLFRVTGRIIRCHVALLDRERIRYRGALMFEQQLCLGEATTRGVGTDT
jgi:PilZ domain-containing protein